MLKKIEIKNFKAINKEDPLILDNLTLVNYLVGKNGSGKSSIIERIYEGEYNQARLAVELEDCCKFNFRDKSNNINPLVITKFSFKLSLNDVDCFQRDGLPVKSSELDVSRLLYHQSTLIDLSHSGGYQPAPHNAINSHFNKFEEAILTTTTTFGIIQKLYKEKFNQELEVKRYNNEQEDNLFGQQLRYFINSNLININKISSGFRALVSILNQIDIILLAFGNNSQPSFEKRTCLIFLEEPENHLHPEWQKEIPKLIHERLEKEEDRKNWLRFFITTHSPLIINTALNYENQNIYYISGGLCKNPEGFNKDSYNDESILSVHKDLGILPSDLFFTNCLIWVEGPTDAIYIEFWLQKYIEELHAGNSSNVGKIKKGVDYEFALFGGASAQNFYLLPEDYEFDYGNADKIKIFNLLKVHPNRFIVIDNDGGKLTDDQHQKKGRSNFEDFKKEVIEVISQEDYWYDKDPNNFTIECYQQGIKINSNDCTFTRDNDSQTKKDFALKYVQKNKDKTFSQITQKACKEMIGKIYSKIIKA